MSSEEEDTIASAKSTPADELVQFMRSQLENEQAPNMALIDVEGFCHANYRIKQYVQGVIDFSSQYGSDYSISYTAPNIMSKPSKYPEYGDFPETFAMRTYGLWWQIAPSFAREFQPENLSAIPTQDFIVVCFEDYIIPDEIAIFETFNPGAIIRIWAYTIAKIWTCLWESKDFCTSSPLPNRARRFSPPLRRIKLPTKIIRLEFNHSRSKYFTEIDAVLLCGQSVNIQYVQQILNFYEQQKIGCTGTILKKLQSIHFRPNFKQNYESQLQNFLLHDLDKFMIQLNASPSRITMTSNVVAKEDDQKPKPVVGLKDMPFEILLNIFSNLDLKSLFRVGLVSRLLYDVSTHPLLYVELNLKPYWHLASSDLLCTLAKRATVLRKLDLSWCGLYNSISTTEFKKFMQQRGDNLTNLRLNSCTFLKNNCIETLGIVCDNLRELSLRNCSTDPPLLNFSSLANLKHLERLDLFQTFIEPDLLLTMLETNPKLRHLNLAFSGVGINMDNVTQHLAKHNKHLVSLDMWKSHFLSSVGVAALSECQQLEEVDFGWCLRETEPGDSLKLLLTKCNKLKKLFLAAMRGLCDRDVADIACLCPNLEQLDLMGVLGISKERYIDILESCKKLQLLDLSFCENVDENEIILWSNTFKVNIKCSHVPVFR